MMPMNPMQLFQMTRGKANPMQVLQSVAPQNPQLRQVMEMCSGRTPNQMRAMAYGLAQQRGIDLDKLAQQMGIRLPK